MSILIVDLEEKSTGDFSVSGGYSTTDGALAEVSISERNFLGRGLYAKASVTYGQYARGVLAVLCRALSARLPRRARTRRVLSPATANSYISYGTTTLGFSPRLGFQLREDLSLQLRYSLYQQRISLPATYNNCNNNAANSCWPSTRRRPISRASWAESIRPTPRLQVYGYGCYGDGESTLPVRKELANGRTLTSALGYTLTYNMLDNNKNPTDGLLVDFRQDFAGVGGNVTYLKTAMDTKYYTPLVSDIVSVIHLQGGVSTRSATTICACWITSRWARTSCAASPPTASVRATSPMQLRRHRRCAGRHEILGSVHELQMPFWFLPKEVGLKGAVYADAGSLWGYQGPTSWAATARSIPSLPELRTQYDDSNVVRSSVGVGLIWASPFGPLRFDYAVPLRRASTTVQEFKFGGGTSF